MANPLPPPLEDPSIRGGYALKHEYASMASALRLHARSDLERARGLLVLWRSAQSALEGMYADLTARRRARLDELERLVPIGPGIAEGTSPADKAVLMSAFRANVAQCRDASNDDFDRLFSDAIKFGDDSMLRALLTVAYTEARGIILQRYRDFAPDTAAIMDEANELRMALDGTGDSALWDAQALGAIGPPDEVADLPRLEKAAGITSGFNADDAAAVQAIRSRLAQQLSAYAHDPAAGSPILGGGSYSATVLAASPTTTSTIYQVLRGRAK